MQQLGLEADLNVDERGKDELIYRHFNSDRHRGLEDTTAQQIHRVKGEKNCERTRVSGVSTNW